MEDADDNRQRRHRGHPRQVPVQEGDLRHRRFRQQSAAGPQRTQSHLGADQEQILDQVVGAAVPASRIFREHLPQHADQIVGGFRPELVNVRRLVALVLREFPGAVVHDGANLLLEVKNPEYPGKLTKSEARWHAAWRGQAAVVRSPEEALRKAGKAVE